MARAISAEIKALRAELAELRTLAELKSYMDARKNHAAAGLSSVQIVEFDWNTPAVSIVKPKNCDSEAAWVPAVFEIVEVPVGVFSLPVVSASTYEFKDCPDDDPNAIITAELEWSEAVRVPEMYRAAVEAQRTGQTLPQGPTTAAVALAPIEARKAADEAALAMIEAHKAKNADKWAREKAVRDAEADEIMKGADKAKEYKPIVITPALPGAGLAEAPKVLEQPHELPDLAVAMAVESDPEPPATEPKKEEPPKLRIRPPATVAASAFPEPIKKPKTPLPPEVRFVPITPGIVIRGG